MPLTLVKRIFKVLYEKVVLVVIGVYWCDFVLICACALNVLLNVFWI